MPSFRIFLILIMGLSCYFFSAEETRMDIARAPQSLSSDYDGLYYLMKGTDACPGKVQWIADCDGFSIYPEDADSQHFCDINKGLQKIETSQVRVTHKDNVYQKIEDKKFGTGSESLILTKEDTIIRNNSKEFLWEHSRYKKGSSCLYAK